MEAYLDEEIIKKREEQKRKKYSSLENGYYVAGKILQFGEKEILGGFRIYLPDNMGTMPEEIARIKYPSEFRPPMILTTVDLSVNIGFNLFERQMEAGETEDMAKRMEAAIEREHPDYRFYGCKEMEKVAGHRFSFRSHGMDSDLYNMMLAVSLEKNLILANFNCPYKDYKHWEKAVVLMWETIRPARKRGDVLR